VYVGAAYWRHEGGIQNEDGTLTHSSTGALFAGTEIKAELDAKEAAFQKVNASRQVWQRKGELSKITSETLLEAATTYIDLLLARTSEVVALQLEKNEAELLESARKLAKTEPPAELQAIALEAESKGHRAAIAKVHQQGDAAALKLAQLLSLDPNAKLMPIDDRLAAFALADANAPVDELVGRALANGPGIRELQGLLGVVQSSIDKAKGPGMLMPILELRMAEGGFGAGPGEDMRWDNRFDFYAQARWNLTDFCKARDQQRIAESKLQQLVLTHQELRQKLTVGVHEARSAALSGEEQIRLGAEQIRQSCKAYQLSNLRRTDYSDQKYKVSEAQALQALRTLEMAHLRYLDAVSNYDKAQLRLLVLTGATTCDAPPPKVAPSNLPKPAEDCPVSPGRK
jgi:outer membrane protein TolC